jgi:hypothetical protein
MDLSSLNHDEGYFIWLTLRYRKHEFVSNWLGYNMLWSEFEMFFADITYKKPNISKLLIHSRNQKVRITLLISRAAFWVG